MMQSMRLISLSLPSATPAIQSCKNPSHPKSRLISLWPPTRARLLRHQSRKAKLIPRQSPKTWLSLMHRPWLQNLKKQTHSQSKELERERTPRRKLVRTATYSVILTRHSQRKHRSRERIPSLKWTEPVDHQYSIKVNTAKSNEKGYTNIGAFKSIV